MPSDVLDLTKYPDPAPDFIIDIQNLNQIIAKS
jgi:hypothetical protein